ncbi:armadillo repeat-containing protein 2 [Ochotona curzoniae]|uniref:armadillo repeat-containing protein 2 n=1 Tax=Ochotona curzoniae TaxID=130825 RepID=UPI001B346F1F|nr:armadillo repeat-containing protein 2 [Ochotona curzoniae]
MLSPSEKKLEKLDPFYRPSASKLKTSAEIISEARNALRTVKTQRPFTPQEDQRKLFGPASSRTPENRPPSTFSLHASSFESSDSRPISGTRLSPLELKPKAPTPPSVELDHCLSLPRPPVDPAKMRRISSARARLFRAASQGPPLPAEKFPASNSQKMVESQETGRMGDSVMAVNGIHVAKSKTLGHVKRNHPLQLTYDGGIRETKEQDTLQGTTSSPSHLQSRGDKEKRCGRTSVSSGSWDLSRLDSKAVSKASPRERDTEIEVDEVFWNTRIVPLLRELEKEGNIESICAACTQLHLALEEGNLLGNKFQRRSVLLKTLYKLVDVGSDLLSLKLAKIILALKVSRKNLLNVCKLVFKISRNEKNDSLLQNDNILESLLEVLRREALQANTEAFLYCMGAIKFISGNPRFLNEMISRGAVEILMDLIKEINENTMKHGVWMPNVGHLLVQVTATLRNLVDSPLARMKLLSTSALPQLCTVIEQYMSDKDVCTNVARIFSKLTSYHDFCVALASCSRCYALFLNLINTYQKQQDLVIRVVFILGNLTAKSDPAREQLCRERGCMQTLLSLFHAFQRLDVPCAQTTAVRASSATITTTMATTTTTPSLPSEAEAVLIKLTRVLANLAIHPRVGPSLASDPHLVGLLVSTLESKSLDDCEELVINTTATINNLSFYQVKNSAIQNQKLYIAELLLKLLVSDNMDGVLEAVRVLGNLSQDHDVCNFIVQHNVHKFLIALLDAKHQDVCFSACGVLLNLTVEKDKRGLLKEGGGIKKLVDCLRDFGPTDWQLACLVCKTLWNFSENITNASSCFGDEDANKLLDLLSSFLDEEVALDGNFDQDLKSYHKLYWETEFKPVAQQLLSRLQRHHTFLEPLPSPSF